MFAKVTSLGLSGLAGYVVQVEADLSSGLPQFTLVGLPDSAVKESSERVRSAVKNLHYPWPSSRITINLAPADVRKTGPVYDLPLLVGLLAEDNALNAEIAVELLQSIGLKVDWAEDGQKAVEMFEKSAPGSYFAVFMDMQMPVMDGVEATRRIRASDRPDHDVPIFAMTANTFAADRKKCYDAGMSGYIPKPIDLETITHVLEEETGE